MQFANIRHKQINNQAANISTRNRAGRAELLTKCKGAPIREILEHMAEAVRKSGGIWFAEEATKAQKHIVEICLFEVVAHGQDNPSACRAWLERAQLPARAA